MLSAARHVAGLSQRTSCIRRAYQLQFEALLAAARASSSPNGFTLVCLLGLLRLRVFEATGDQPR